MWKFIEGLGVKVGDFFSAFVKIGTTIKDNFKSLGPETLVCISQVFYDVIKTAGIASETAADASAGNWAGAVQLSEQTVASVIALITAFKAANKQIVADFEALKLSIKA